MLDELDLKIIEAFNKNGDTSMYQIAKDIGEPRNKVSYRIDKMVDKEYIKNNGSAKKINDKKVKVTNSMIAYRRNSDNTPVFVAKKGTKLYDKLMGEAKKDGFVDEKTVKKS